MIKNFSDTGYVIVKQAISKNLFKNIQDDIFDGTYDNIIFSKTSFDGLEFKFSKKYDVSELPDALEAHYGFFQRREFEIRFYPSNEIAKSSGIFFAEEATGEDAIIKKSDASWKEGIKDRMTSGAFGNKKKYSQVYGLCNFRKYDCSMPNRNFKFRNWCH